MKLETVKLIARANELADLAEEALREKRAYYDRQSALQKAYEAAKAAVVAARGTSAEFDALRAFFAINEEWNLSEVPEYSDALKAWDEAKDRAYRAVLEDSGLKMHLSERL